MTNIIYYGNLTWPEIKALPSSFPIILPLGIDYDINLICSRLCSPPSIVILPPLPFGWVNSGLEVKEEIFNRLLRNLIGSLKDDGFDNIYVAAPYEITSIPESSFLSNLKESYTQSSILSPETNVINKLVLIPTGHIEQHSYHLPMSTDTVIIEAIADGIIQAVPGLCTMLPVMPYGVSTHRSSFFGTFNAGGREYEDFWLNVIQRLVDLGYDRFYLINGHGGNSSFLANVVKYAGEQNPRIFCATSWLYLSGPDGIRSLEIHRDSPVGGMGHAGELETSLMLHLRKESVHMELVKDDTDFISTPSYYMDWIEGGSIIANPPWYDDSKYGAYGAGSLGSAEKGSIWLKDAINEKISHIHEINQQQLARELRRNSGYGEWGSLSNSNKKK